METVDLPVQPPLEPMLAKAQAKVPTEHGVWSYEPKWDGFLYWILQVEAPIKHPRTVVGGPSQ